MPLDMAPSLGPSQKPETIEIPLELPGFEPAQEPGHLNDLLLLHEQRITYAMEEWFSRLEGLIKDSTQGQVNMRPVTPTNASWERAVTTDSSPTAEASTSSLQRRTSVLEGQEEEEKGEKICAWLTKEVEPYQWQKPLRHIVTSLWFESFFAGVIFTNSVFIAYQVEAAAIDPGRGPSAFVFIVSSAYTFLFTMELLLRIVAFGPRGFCGEDWMWMWLDTAVVLSSILEFALELPMHQEDAGSSNNSISNVRLLRVLRVAKVTRALRILRVVKFVRSLKSLLFCIGRTMRALAWSAVLLMLIIFVFGLIFTDITAEYFSRSDRSSDAETEAFLAVRFGGLLRSMHTLYASITGGFTWVEARDVFATYISEFTGLLFEGYIAFCLFAVLNVMTGVFCHSAIESADKDHEMNLQMLAAERAKYFRAVRRLFARLDADNDGGITAKEFEVALQDAALISVFDALEISVEDAWALFRTLDSDGDSHVGPQEFVDGCLRCKGPARAIDVVCIKRDLHTVLNKLESQALEVAAMRKQAGKRV